MNQTLCKEKVRNGNILGAWWSAKIYVNVSRERVRNGKTRAHKSGRRPSSAHCLSIINRGLWKVFKKSHLTYFLWWFPLNIHINFSRERARNVKTRAHNSGCCPSSAHCLSIMNRNGMFFYLDPTSWVDLTILQYWLQISTQLSR